MRTIIVALAGLLFTAHAYGQGGIYFNNRIPGILDARVTLPGGSGAGLGWTAQLYGGAEGTPVTDLKPLLPATTFRTTSADAMGYVDPVDVIVPGVAANSRATVVLRAFHGTSFETAPMRGESSPITIAVGGGFHPPANLIGLKGFISTNTTVSVTPKPAIVDGTVVFNNYIPGIVDARVLLADGGGAGTGWTAQLYGGPEGSSGPELKRLYPTTTFRTTSADAMGYVQAVDVSVAGIASGAKATLVMRVFNGATFETSSVQGETAPVTVTLGGGLVPPANLSGLHGFTLPTAPMPPLVAGTVTFNNRVPGTLDARVLLPDGAGIGAGWTAELRGGPEGGSLVPLSPATTFRTSSAFATGYVEPVVVTVPGVSPGSKATLVMTAFLGVSRSSAALYGESMPITVTVGGGTLPPSNLDGLTGFTVVNRAPVILKQPIGQTLAIGDTANLTVEASGAGLLNYQWRFNGKVIIGAASASYSINGVQLSQSGSYTVTVRNAFGEVSSAAAVLSVTPPGSKGDLNGDGFADLLFQDEDGHLAIWSMDGAKLRLASFLTPNRLDDAKWRIAGTGRFNSDAHEDLVFQHRDGTLAAWYMDGVKLQSGTYLDPKHPAEKDWRVVGTGDFNSDGKTDLLYQHEDGTLSVWHMDGVKLASSALLTPDHPGDEDWRVAGTGDFNGDGKTDLIFQHEDGTLAYWCLDGGKLIRSGLLKPHHPRDKHWRVGSVVDLNHDGKLDLVFQHKEEGDLAVWFMDGINLESAQLLTPSRVRGSWKLVAP